MGSREDRAERFRRLIQGQPVDKAAMERLPPKARDLSQVRPVIRAEVSEQAKKASQVFKFAMAGFMAATPGLEARLEGDKSELLKLFKVGTGLRRQDIFKNCQVQYGYNQRQRIYSIKAILDSRPRIITIRVGKDFTEVSLADKKNEKILETLRQQDGKGVTFNKTD